MPDAKELAKKVKALQAQLRLANAKIAHLEAKLVEAEKPITPQQFLRRRAY